ncbi:MAG: anthranilate synthase component I [Parvularculaceae bacterium]
MTAADDGAAFRERYDAGAAQIVTRRIASDLETPVSAYLKLAGGRAPAFLLESVEGGERLGRYSIVGRDPDLVWTARDGRVEIEDVDENRRETDDRPAVESLKAFVDAARISARPDDARDRPPMSAGVFGFLSYDMIREIERLGERPPPGVDAPEARFIRPRLIAAFDNVRQEIVLATPARPAAGLAANDAYETAIARLDAATADLRRDLGDEARAFPVDISQAEDPFAEVSSNRTPEDYCAAIDRAKAYIEAGDVFQTVLSQRFEAPFDRPAFDLYRAVRRTNPSPFLFFLDFGDGALVGSSPEILVRVRGGEVTIRPIAGTRPRGRDAAADAANEADLLADPKERAEHLMLLDLGRNDVGRAAAMGTVRGDERFAVERYSHVMHIVSNVTGDLRDGLHPVDAVMAGFPAGTVSGAPKIRAMQIIDELEPSARGPYAGAIGYFSADGDVDTCIALRTAYVKDGVMSVQAGAGIVADSDPLAEHEECLNKARALFAAAAIARRR